MKQLVVEERTAPYVFFHVVIEGGSLHDEPGKEGKASLTGNGLLCGTEQYTRTELFEALDALGASLSVSVLRDYTILEGEVLSRNLEPFVALVSSVLNQPVFPTAEIDKLKRRVLAELASIGDNDEVLAGYLHTRFQWQGHRFAKPVGGTKESVSVLEVEDLQSFHRSRLERGVYCVAAAGDVSSEEVASLVRTYLSPSAQDAPTDLLEIPPYQAPPGIRVLLVDKPERTQAQVHWGHACVPAAHSAIYPLRVANSAFGGTFTARLMHEIREKRGWSYGAYSNVVQNRRIGRFSMRYNVDAAHLADALELAHDLMRTWVAEGLSSEELAFSKGYLSNAYAFQCETASRRLGQLLEMDLVGRPEGHIEKYVERIQQVTEGDIKDALHAHIHPEEIALSIVCTASQVEDRIAKWPGLTELRVLPYDESWSE